MLRRVDVVGEAAPAGFVEFYAASRQRLLRVLIAAGGDAGEAEDALQEAYVRTAERWRKVGRYDDPEGFTRRVALNLLSDGRKRLRRREAAYRRVGAPADASAPDPDSVAVLQAMRELPTEQREALALHYLLDMSVEQVARDLRRPVNTVKTHLSRGRAALARALSEGEAHAHRR